MTLAAVWVEDKSFGNKPLCFASDSRTTPGPIEGITKVSLFGREDLAGVWAGDYRYASVVMSHLDAVFTASEAMRRRDVDLARALRQAETSVRRHLMRSMNPSVPTPQRIPYAQLPERTVILVGGYSVMESSHVLLRIEWRPDDARWRVSVGHVDQSKVTFIGDDVKTAKQVVRRARVHRSPVGAGWQMEPLLAIHNACEDSHKATIGGRLQMAKAYMHGSARAYGFIDSARGNDIVVRATIVDSRAARELVASRLVIDLSCYQLNSGTYTTLRKLQRPDSI